MRELKLLGSRARGEGHASSDLDILVLVDGLTREERGRILDLSADVELDTRLVLSPVVVATERWDTQGPLARNVAQDGVSL
ncbi:MAG: nucleotidyltransferase domain-containing protein [Myxococcota bacterium]